MPQVVLPHAKLVPRGGGVCGNGAGVAVRSLLFFQRKPSRVNDACNVKLSDLSVHRGPL